MKTLRLFAAFFLGTALVACASLTTAPSTASQVQTIETACASSSAALRTFALVAQAGALSTTDATSVSAAAAVVTPLCTASAPPTYSDVQLAALAAATSTLVALSTKYGASP